MVPLFGLAPGGVYLAIQSPECWWALTSPFHPYLQRRSEFGKVILWIAWFQLSLSGLWSPLTAVYFCGTFLGVAPTGRYPAPCPAELRLSSD